MSADHAPNDSTLRAEDGCFLLDSIALVTERHAGAVVVTGSHGGTSAAHFVLALRHKPRAVFFNDAGIGKDGAGLAALALLQAVGVAAATYAHSSARIGEAEDGWRCGVVSANNDAAADAGVCVGMTVRRGVARVLG